MNSLIPRFFSSFLFLSLSCLPVSGQQQSVAELFGDSNKSAAPKLPESKVEFVSEAATIAPGKPFEVAIRLEHPEHWHSYYVNPGGPGLLLTPNWKLPEGFEVERVAWPVPELGTTAGQKTYGYEGVVYHLFSISPPADQAEGSPVEISIQPFWQICDEKNCVREPPFNKNQTYSLTLNVGAEAEVDPAQAEAFEKARAMLPAPLPEKIEITAIREASSVKVILSPADAVPEGDVYFFDEEKILEAQAKPLIERNEDGVSWSLPKVKGEDAPQIDRLKGILTIGETGFAIDVAFGKAPLPKVGFGTLLGILGGMFVGGLILNLMPCVFPVIGLKIMSFVQQAGEESKKIAMHGLIFVFGVILSFWVLAGTLLALREGLLGSGSSEEINWGYQLQNPWVVWGLMLVMFVLALNMFGVFEIGMAATGVGGGLTQKQGVSGTFFSGVLATVVATPCSAPFLGAALGATFALPSVLFMLSFTAMAVGLAFPYLFLSMFPQLVQKLPRPGPWMESFKQAMSFLLFATAGYLLWIFVKQIRLDAMLNVVIGLAALAVAVWIYGRWCTLGRKKPVRATGAVFALLFAVAGIAFTKPPGDKKLVWEDWSPAAVEAAIEDGRPVYVDFTAAWCATCQVNKRNAYGEEVRKLFAEHEILALQADKTSPDPEIDAAIRDLGRAAVPVNVLYVPGDAEPHITKELFTESYLADFIATRLAKSSE